MFLSAASATPKHRLMCEHRTEPVLECGVQTSSLMCECLNGTISLQRRACSPVTLGCGVHPSMITLRLAVLSSVGGSRMPVRHRHRFTGSSPILLLLLATACGDPAAGSPTPAKESTAVTEAAPPTSTHLATSTEPASPATTNAPSTEPPPATDLSDIALVEIGTHVSDISTPPWSKDGELIPELMPEWIAVGDSNGFVIGYKHLDPAYDEMTPEELEAAGHPELLIYDANRNVIGRFVDGTPVLDGAP